MQTAHRSILHALLRERGRPATRAGSASSPAVGIARQGRPEKIDAPELGRPATFPAASFLAPVASASARVCPFARSIASSVVRSLGRMETIWSRLGRPSVRIRKSLFEEGRTHHAGIRPRARASNAGTCAFDDLRPQRHGPHDGRGFPGCGRVGGHAPLLQRRQLAAPLPGGIARDDQLRAVNQAHAGIENRARRHWARCRRWSRSRPAYSPLSSAHPSAERTSDSATLSPCEILRLLTYRFKGVVARDHRAGAFHGARPG